VAWGDTICIECNMDTSTPTGPNEWFMLVSEVWALTGLSRTGGVLCIGCTERRVGRELAPDDFDGTLGTNRPSLADSDRMLNRLGYRRRVNVGIE
jgi:hypothetical protein